MNDERPRNWPPRITMSLSDALRLADKFDENGRTQLARETRALVIKQLVELEAADRAGAFSNGEPQP